MRDLSELLKKIYRSLNKDAITKEAITTVIMESVGVSLQEDKVSLKEGVLEVVSSPSVNNEIRFKEDLIKDRLREVYQIHVSQVRYK